MERLSDKQLPVSHDGDQKVLIVEADPAYSTLLLLDLQRANIDYYPPLTSGPEAVEAAVRLNPAVMVLDIDLAGGMNGVEVAEKVAELRTILVIFLSGNSDAGVISSAQATFPFAYLTKPAKPNELTALIHGAFRYRECLRVGLPENDAPAKMMTICAWCRSVKSSQGWQPLADSVIDAPLLRFSHGVCESCMNRIINEEGLE
ncbi:MAG: response regulator [Limisphaerales bacterium]